MIEGTTAGEDAAEVLDLLARRMAEEMLVDVPPRQRHRKLRG